MEDLFLWSYASRGFRAIREDLTDIAAAVDANEARHTKAVSSLKNELDSMRGDVQQRLTALTNAFVAFVELDGIRKELESFPVETTARRHAREDINALLAGTMPPPRDDIPGYWLMPAVAALKPDGAIDPVLAEEALGRDEVQARMFLTCARAALGAGPAAIEEVDKALKPAADGTWDESQLITWLVTLRGAFGNQALSRLRPFLTTAAQAAEDWPTWAVSVSGKASSTQALSWVEEQILTLAPDPESPVPAVEALPNFSHDGWRALSGRRRLDGVVLGQQAAHSEDPPGPDFQPSGQGLDGSATRSEEADTATEPSLAAESDSVPAAEEPPLATTQQEEDQATHAMLVKILHVLIGRGTPPEEALLARAAVLEEQFTNPSGAVALPEEVPEPRYLVVDMLREAAVNEKVRRPERFQLWRLIGEALLPTAEAYASGPALEVPTVEVASGLTVDPNGVTDRARLRHLHQQIDASQPTGLTAQGPVILGLCVVVGVVLGLFVTKLPMLWWPILICMIVGIWAADATSSVLRSRASRKEDHEVLDYEVAYATTTAKGILEKAQQERAERIAAGKDFIAVMEQVRRL